MSRRLHIAENPGFLRALAAILAHSADSWFWLVGLVLVWWLGTDYWKRRAAILMVDILILAAVVLVIKFSVRRSRPAGEWGKIYRRTDPHSFPSGHAARAVLLVVLTLGLGPAWLSLVLLLWAPFVILARVAMGVHYLSDVIAGALLGALGGAGLLLILPAFLA
jgi:undecaprenyl-diphosphatase